MHLIPAIAAFRELSTKARSKPTKGVVQDHAVAQEEDLSGLDFVETT